VLRRTKKHAKQAKYYEIGPGDTCGDCGRVCGQYHMVGCDIEVCPKCKGQKLSCGCFERRSLVGKKRRSGRSTKRVHR
jgi:hypothetical protein